MRSPDCFNVARFAQAHYSATNFRSLGDDRYAADGTLELRGASKPVTLTFTWTPGAAPVLLGKATVKRLDFGGGGGDWADTDAIPNEVAVSTRVVLKPAQEPARQETSGGSPDRKSTRLNSSHYCAARMPTSA